MFRLYFTKLYFVSQSSKNTVQKFIDLLLIFCLHFFIRSKMKDQKKAGNLTDDSDSSTKLIEMSNMKSSSLSECLLEPTAFEVQEKEVNTSFESNESDDGDSLDMVESKNSDQICKGKEDNMLDPKDNNWSGEDTAMR
jgi:hypothetical protein